MTQSANRPGCESIGGPLAGTLIVNEALVGIGFVLAFCLYTVEWGSIVTDIIAILRSEGGGRPAKSLGGTAKLPVSTPVTVSLIRKRAIS